MLDLFRRKKSGLKWILWIVIFALSGGMLLLFVDVPTGVGVTPGNLNVAVVAGNRVTVAEYQRAFGRLYDTYSQNYRLFSRDPALLNQLGLPKQALDGLINRHAINYEATRLGLSVSSQETVDHIATNPIFQENGKFIGTEKYKRLLQHSNLSTAEYEKSVQIDILAQKLQNLLTDGIMPTFEETYQEFVSRNQKVKLHYLAIDPNEIKSSQVAEEDLQAYFLEYQNEYEIEEKRKIGVVKISVKTSEVGIREEDIQMRMASLNELERVRASHIMVAPRDPEKGSAEKIAFDPDEDAKKRAGHILNLVRGGANFAKLAKRYSDDPGSKDRGGDLGFFERGQMLPAFEKVAFSLEPGEISDLVRTGFGYHIVKVTEAPKIDRREVAESQLRQAEAKVQASNLATKIIYQTKKESGLIDIAKKYELEVKETPFFSLGDIIPDLQVRSDFNQQIFTLLDGQIIDKPYASGESYLVAELREIQSAQPMTFEEAKGQVAEDLQSTLAEQQAKEQAFNLVAAARQEKSVAKAARAQGKKIVSTDFFKKGDAIDPALGPSDALHKRAFPMRLGEISSVIPISDMYVIFQLMEKSSVDEKQFEQEKEQIRKELTSKQRVEFFDNWLKNLTDRLYEEEQIQINQDVVDAATGLGVVDHTGHNH